jgi:hypothetical protein
MEIEQNDRIREQTNKKSDQPEKPEREYPQKQPGILPLPNKQNIPAKPDNNPDPTRLIPGVNEPEKNDPTRIDEPPNVPSEPPQ